MMSVDWAISLSFNKRATAIVLPVDRVKKVTEFSTILFRVTLYVQRDVFLSKSLFINVHIYVYNNTLYNHFVLIYISDGKRWK